MIKVTIKETGAKETLSIVDPRSNVDFVSDFIGNHGAFIDGQFTYDEDSDMFAADQDTYDWWAKVTTDHQALEDRIAELEEEHGKDRVQAVVHGASDCDLEDMASAVNGALDEEFGNE
ncbi:hypothetical protein WMW72_12025 [Paenibacillus filicis]|uniref:Uncharacterized protein n=1 Tax=Paenibacillus filicis TaxID=669464 RepID=A0ABU9DIE6_9BACL